MLPEEAHYAAMGLWSKLNHSVLQQKIIGSIMGVSKYNTPVEVAGISFPNRVGLAAGFDKDALWIDALANIGFGHIEVGTLTPKPQPGNEKPRLFRLKQDEALVNRMGFNNQGVEVAMARLNQRKTKIIIGGNIGKNKNTPNLEALQDYVFGFDKLYNSVDYFTVNVSSPNTPNLRDLQEKGPLLDLLKTLVRKRNEKMTAGNLKKPIFLKIAPDMSFSQLDDILEVCFDSGIEGIVATNTTTDRSMLLSSKQYVEAIGAGGLSGRPVFDKSNDVLRYIAQKSEGKLALIGVGGIMGADDAKRKLDCGADLIQIYTGFIYKGMGIVKEIKKGLAGI